MPKRKRTFRRKRRAFRRKFKRRTMRVRPELKYIAQAIAATPVVLAGAVANISSLAQGVGQAQRVGNRVLNKYTYIKGFFNNGDPAIQAVRMIVFKWKQAAAPVVASILGFAGLNSPYAVETAPFFRILMDKTFTLSPAGLEGGLKRFSKRMSHRYISQYNGAAAVNIIDGSLWVLVIGTSVLAAYEYDVITKYVDA